jgi:glycosyltransferase involved in cell wall biosynthesis
MKLLLLCKYAGFRCFNRPTRQVFLSEALSSQGDHVLLLSSRSNGMSIPGFKGSRQTFHHDRFTEMILNGPTVGLGFNFKRIFSWLIYEVMILLNFSTIRRFRPDVILVSSLSLLTLLTGVLLKKLLRVPLAIEVRDIHPLTLVEVGKFNENSLVVRVLAFIERYGYRNADLLISPLEHFDIHVATTIPNPAPFIWIPMGYSGFFLYPSISDYSASILSEIRAMKKDGRLVYAYAGALGRANDLERIFKIVQSLKEHPISFVFIGDGPLKKQFVSKFGELSNVRFYNQVPKSDVCKILSECDLLLHPVQEIPLYRYGVSPNKWIDYALSKRPFLTTLQADLKVKTIAGNAFVTPDGSDSALRSELIRISHLPPELLTEMGQKGYDYVIQNLSYDKLAADLKAALSETIARYHAGAKA